VDGDGRVFVSDEAPRLPVVQGWTGRAAAGATLDQATVEVIDAFERFPAELRRRTAGINVGPPLTLLLTNGTQVRFGTHQNLQDKAVAAVAVLAAERGKDLEYVDVRSPRVPVTRLRPPPTPAPTPQPTARATPAAPATPSTPSPTPATPASPGP
jgi:cell division septal protein FtsQ